MSFEQTTITQVFSDELRSGFEEASARTKRWLIGSHTWVEVGTPKFEQRSKLSFARRAIGNQAASQRGAPKSDIHATTNPVGAFGLPPLGGPVQI